MIPFTFRHQPFPVKSGAKSSIPKTTMYLSSGWFSGLAGVRVYQ
ncbi:hypothetical protein [Nostoc sp.]